MKRHIVIAVLVAMVAALCAGPAWAVKIVHITDIHVGGGTVTGNGEFDQDGRNFAKLRDYLVNSVVPDFVIATGDIVDHGMTSQNAGVETSNWTALTGKLYKSGNTYYLKSNYTMPIFFVPGNHDDRPADWGSVSLLSRSMTGYDNYIPRTPTAPSGYTIIANGSERDYAIKYGNTLVFCLYSGKDALPGSEGISNPYSAGLTQSQIDFMNNTRTANPGLCNIVAMHHPYINPDGDGNAGTTFDGDKFGYGYTKTSGCIFNKRTEFLNAMQKDVGGTFQMRFVLSGHLHQNVILDRDGIKRAQDWRTAPVYVQTAEALNGAYRVIDIYGATSYTIRDAQRVPSLYAAANFLTPYENQFVYAGNAFVASVKTAAADAVTKVELYMDGAFQYALTSPPYSFTLMPLTAKSGECKLTAKAYNALGTTSSSIIVQKAVGADAYYDRLNVGNTAYVNCPKCKGVMSVKLNEIRVNAGNSKRQADLTNSCGCGSWTTLIDVEQAYRLGGGQTGLFAFPARIFDGGGLRCADIMIGPYQYPSVEIISPMNNQQTNICEVKLATNYSGRDIPWTNASAGAPVLYGALKTINWTYVNTGATGSTVNDNFVWNMSSGTGARTLTVKIKDVFGTEVGKNVTVTYNSGLPFYVYRGFFGDTWKGMSLSLSACSHGDPIATYNFWNGSDPMGTHWGGSSMGRAGDRDGFITIIANAVISGALSQQVPGGSTTVLVASKNTGDAYNYTSGSVSGAPFGTITMKEIYDRVAGILGRDSNNKYRVWVSTSAAARSSTDAIPDALPPSAAIVNPPSGAYVNTSLIKVEGTASDDLLLSYIDVSINGGSTWKRAVGTTSWSCDVTFPSQGTYTIQARATDSYGRTATTSRSVIYDATACVINIGEPTAGSSFPCDVIRVAGTASDNQGVANVKVRVNGGPWMETGQTTKWGTSITLAAGTNVITAQATDISGNISTASVSVSHVSGTPPPAAAISLPSPTVSGLGMNWDCGWYFGGVLYLAPGMPDACTTTMGGSAVYDFGSTRNYTVSAPISGASGGCNSCSSGNGSVSVSLESSFDGITYVSFASTGIGVNGNGGGGSISGSFYGRYMRANVSVTNNYQYCAYCGCGKNYSKGGISSPFTVTAGSACGPTNLVGYWSLNESSGTIAYDYSGNNNNGTAYNSPSWLPGKTGNALSFNGSSQYVAASASSLYNLNQLTIAMWIKTPSSFGYSGWRNLLSKQGANRDYNFYAYSSDGAKICYLHFSSAVFGSSYSNYFVYEPNTWHHVALTVSTTGATTYYSDGVAIGTYAGTAGTAGNSYPIWIARADNYWKGIIDEVRLYNKALSATEVQAVYNGNKAASVGNLAAVQELSWPVTTQLLRSMPNPFSGQTTINFQLAAPAQTAINVYNIMGQCVKTLVNECLRPGYHSVKWDGKDADGNKVAAGVYLYRMQAGDYTKTNKMTVLR